jgi:RNA polymerase sigma-70 factor (ECF subfamily)
MTTLARSMLRDRDQADDVVVSALLRIHEAAPRFRGESSLKTWALRIVANLCRDELRRRKFSAGPPEDLDPLAAKGLVVEPVDEWDEAMDRGVLMARLEQEIDRLSPDQREAVILRDRLGLPYEEAAQALGIRVGAFKARLFRAREALRRALGETTGRKSEES